VAPGRIARSLPRAVELLLIALILVVVVVFVTAPLRHARGQPADVEDSRLAELEARKEAKYREIRDAELDREAGKLSEVEWRRQDTQLRREAIQILKEIDRLSSQ
jgi:predicted Holliday junction resolvase-like endonuclease